MTEDHFLKKPPNSTALITNMETSCECVLQGVASRCWALCYFPWAARTTIWVG